MAVVTSAFDFVADLPAVLRVLLFLVALGVAVGLAGGGVDLYRKHQVKQRSAQRNRGAGRSQHASTDEPPNSMFRIRGGQGFEIEDNLSVGHDRFVDAEDASDFSAKGNRSFRRGEPDLTEDRGDEDGNEKDDECQP